MLNRAHSAVCQLQHVRDIIQASDVNGSDSADSEEMAEKTWVVGIEKFMKGFSMGKTSTNSLFNLAQFNKQSYQLISADITSNCFDR